MIAWVAAASLFSVMIGLYASTLSLSLLGAARDVCQLLSDLAAAQWYCRFLQQSCGSIFGSILARFGVILGLGGDLETSWGAFVPHLCPRTFPSSIFGSFWEAPGTPFGTLFGQVFGPRPAAEPPGGHF